MFLITASKSSDPALRKIVEKTEAILMLSVPHGGSPVATLNPPARFLLLPSVEVEELRKGTATAVSFSLFYLFIYLVL